MLPLYSFTRDFIFLESFNLRNAKNVKLDNKALPDPHIEDFKLNWIETVDRNHKGIQK